MIEARVCLLDRLFYGLILLYMRASCYGSEKYCNKMIEVRVSLQRKDSNSRYMYFKLQNIFQSQKKILWIALFVYCWF